MYNTSLHYGPYVYPRWGKALGVCMATVSCLQILIWAVVAISKETGTLKEVCVSSPLDTFVSLKPNLWCKHFLSCFFFLLSLQRFKKSIRPLNSWRVNNATSSARMAAQMAPERVDAPFTVTLTDMDFNALTWEVGSQAWGRNKHPKEQMTGAKGCYVLFIPARLVVGLCPAGQRRFLIFIYFISVVSLFFLIWCRMELKCDSWS